jgi:ornithine cyclodeaminase
MKFFSAREIDKALTHSALIEGLRIGFTEDYTIPPRMHMDYDNPVDVNQNTMLLMPAVKCGKYAGVKIVNVSLKNDQRNIPSIQGIYYLIDAITGEPKAIFDAKSLTNWRTAAASALAADYLAREDASSLLMIGTGSLAPYLIDAHSSIRNIKKLFIYGRTKEKAEKIANQKSDLFEKVQVVDDLKDALPKSDIISAATFSTTPLINGKYLKPGQHIDLVGAFKPTSRESDDETIQKASVFIDSEMACKEAGDIAIPISTGTLTEKTIQGDLFQLCRKELKGRKSKEEITLFKSVGHALEDLVAAQLIYDKGNS